MFDAVMGYQDPLTLCWREYPHAARTQYTTPSLRPSDQKMVGDYSYLTITQSLRQCEVEILSSHLTLNVV